MRTRVRVARHRRGS